MYNISRNDANCRVPPNQTISLDQKGETMSTRTCLKCGNPIPVEAISCPQCGSISMRLGKSGERSITRTQALLVGILLLLFPLCCLGSVGYRLVNDQPVIQALFPGDDSEDLASVSGEDGKTPGDVNEVDDDMPTPEGTTEATESVTLTPEGSTPDPLVTLSGILASGCIPKDTSVQVGEVKQIIDGDEIVVKLPDGDFTIRYIGVASPNVNEAGGPDASNANINLVLLKTVTLVQDVTEMDPEGRLLRYVFVGDIFVNYQLILDGLVYAENMPPDVACSGDFQAAESSAQNLSVGLWEPTPEPDDTLISLWTATPDNASSDGQGKANCNCSGPDLSCDDFGTKAEAQACFIKCVLKGLGDVFDLEL